MSKQENNFHGLKIGRHNIIGVSTIASKKDVLRAGAFATALGVVVGGIAGISFALEDDTQSQPLPSPITESGTVFDYKDFSIDRISSQIFEVNGKGEGMRYRNDALRVIDDNFGCDITSVSVDDAANPRFDFGDDIYVVVKEGSCESLETPIN